MVDSISSPLMLFDFLSPSLVSDEQAKLHVLDGGASSWFSVKENKWGEFLAVCKLLWIDEKNYKEGLLHWHHLPEAKWSEILEDATIKDKPKNILAAKLGLEVVRLRLKLYPTSLEQDEQQYRELPTFTGSEESSALNLHNALVVRIGEKRILHRAAEVLEAGVKKYDTSDKKRKPEGAGRDRSQAKKAK